ncbi:RusA family crossover junction endodeoxyribonuclease [Streptomyces echinoruber]|uniref:RusA family crossover junction endodeoxyribonuclease n=1 Tax=Streptomyces echinoruber TaxID=68898 RepID=UPI00167D1F08|nr:RusA family crossover junction endodeoxyribonuclease [Streptomyces echinoruber]
MTPPAPGGSPTTQAAGELSGTKPVFDITVHGTPGPQGSKTRNPSGALYESSAKVKPWREAVKSAALDALAYDEAWRPLREAVRLEVVFTLRRPRSHYGTGRNAGVVKPSAPQFPIGKPDTDKLLRSTQDALKDAGVLLDDSVVTDTVAAKRYVLTGVDALSHPGAVIRVWRLTKPKEPES